MKGKLTSTEESLPISFKEKKRHWLKKAVSPIDHKAGAKKASGDLEGVWKYPASEPGCEKCFVFNCTPNGIKLVGILNRMGMELMCKLAS
eukprot:scaffold234648_cov17-Tisochrysis_lutea.AAC.2